VFGAPLIRRAGPIRALQVGLALSAIGAAILAVPVVAVAVVACVLIGLGYGPRPPPAATCCSATRRRATAT